MLAQLLIRAASSGVSGFQFKQTISADTTNYNLRSAALAGGWDGVKPLLATVTINSGVVVSSDNTTTPAFDTGSGFPAGSQLELVNNGYVCGMGGRGGSNYNSSHQGGGTALRASFPLSVTNVGVIAGGGGGGREGSGDPDYAAGGGGGRSGRHNSAGGTGYYYGGAGTFSSGGGGGNGGAGGTTGPGGDAASGLGGGGGGWGSNGGGNGWYAGGAGGSSVTGNSYITWLATGTRYGSIT